MGDLREMKVKVKDLCNGFLLSSEVLICERGDNHPLYEGWILDIPSGLQEREVRYVAAYKFDCFKICLA